MKQVSYNLNNYQMNLRNVQKKETEEKTKDTKGETKVESQAPATVNAEPVTANALDVIAKQNMGLQDSLKPKEVDKGGKGNTEWYENLVTQWNQNHNNWSIQEQVDFVTQIIDVAPTNKVTYWHCVRGELRGQLIEEKFSHVDPNTMGPSSPFGNYNGDYGADFVDFTQDEHFSAEMYNHPDEYTNSERVQGYKVWIQTCKIIIAQYSKYLDSPNFTTDDKIRFVHEIENRRAEIVEYQRKIKELEGTIVKDDSIAVQAQGNNTPSVD